MKSSNNQSFHNFWNELRLRDTSYENLFQQISPILNRIEESQTSDRSRFTETELFLYLKNIDLFQISGKEKESKKFLARFISRIRIDNLFELFLGFMLLCQFSAKDFPRFLEKLILIFKYNKLVSIEGGEYKLSIEQFVRNLLQANKLLFETSFEAELLGLNKQENRAEIEAIKLRVESFDMRELENEIFKIIFQDGQKKNVVDFDDFFENVFPKI